MPHIHEKIDWSVDVLIVHEDKVLLRKHDKYKVWLMVGGHIELDEDPVAAALREVQEEVGLTVELLGDVPQLSEGEGYRELLAPRFMNIHPISDTHQHISLVYVARALTTDIVEGEGEKSDEIRWFTNEELDDPSFGIKETIRYYAKAALAARK